jgi:WD40 repeat protein
MVMFTNQNILKLIFENLALFTVQTTFENTNNRIINTSLLKILSFEKIFKSLGKSKQLLGDCGERLVIWETAVLPDGNIIATGYDKKLTFWDVKDFKCVGTIEVGSVQKSLQVLPDFNVASMSGKQVKIRKIIKENGCYKEASLKLADVKNPINDKFYILSEGIIAFIAIAGTIPAPQIGVIYTHRLTIYDYNEGNTVKVLEDQGTSISSIKSISNNRFASTSDKSVKVWDAGYNLITTLEGHNSNVYGLDYNTKKNLLFSKSRGIVIKCWNLNDYQCVRTVNTGLLNCQLLTNEYLVFLESYDMKILDMDGKCLNTLYAHGLSNFMLLNDNRIAFVHHTKLFIWDY